jgi:hypothetical protein
MKQTTIIKLLTQSTTAKYKLIKMMLSKKDRDKWDLAVSKLRSDERRQLIDQESYLTIPNR